MFFLSFHSEEDSQQVALIRREKGLYAIEHLRTLPANVNPLDILRPFLEQKKIELVTGLLSPQVVLRTLSLKLKTRREILAALPFQVENLLPYPKEELIVLPTLFPHKEKETDIFLLATSQKEVTSHLDQCAKLGVDPDIVTCVPLALFRFARHFFPQAQRLCHFHIGQHQSRFVLIEEGRLSWAQSQNFGRSHLEDDATDSVREIERTIAYIQKKNPRIDQILLTGDEASTKKLSFFFAPHFSLLELENPRLKEYALPIGLGLDGGSRDKHQANFRLRSTPSVRKKKILSNLRSRFLAGCAAFCMITLFMGHLHLKQREKQVVACFPKSSSKKLSHLVNGLSSDILRQKTGKVPLTSTPQVTDLLTFLSTHPALPEGASIEKVRMQLTSPPKLGTNTSSSLAKVEIELNIPSAKQARDFHQALLAETNWIDRKKGIDWSGDHGLYRATFTFRDKP